MSNSVDEAVFDYFSILLNDKEEKQPKKPASSHDSQISVASDNNDKDTAIEQPVGEKRDGQMRSDIVAEKAVAHPDIAEPVKIAAPQVQPQRNRDSISAKEYKEAVDTKALEQLLASVNSDGDNAKQKVAAAAKTIAVNDVKPKIVEPNVDKVKEPQPVETVSPVQEVAVETAPATQVSSAPPAATEDLIEKLDDEFQVLFFKVAGLTLAVPLVSLGGIVKLQRVNHIMGRPNWYHGVQAHRESQLNVVDTCAWVMPEKYDENLKNSVDYQYVVVLEDSNWGLTCESLVNSVRILKSEVNWRTKPGKRPWLAGVVKEQMCGILHVQALIELLNLGLGSQDAID